MKRIFALLVIVLIALSFYLLLISNKKTDSSAIVENISNTFVVEISERNIDKNLFQTQIDPSFLWFSVGQGAYNKQYYSRDTFISFIGAKYSDKLRPILAHAIDWFSVNQEADGYIPIWFQETQTEKINLDRYYFAPYNRTEKDGGIRQIDHVEEYIDAIYQNFVVTQDIIWLRTRINNAEKSWQYLSTKTNENLIVSPYSDFAGADWADLIRRNGKASFVNAYWYLVTNHLAELEEILGNNIKETEYKKYAEKIKTSYNNVFWIKSKPTNCSLGETGHYLSWVDGKGIHDYFDLDSNSLAVASGLADEQQTKSIMSYINSNFDYFVNKYGATRVVCGTYSAEDTTVIPGQYQNGAYWYLPSYFLAMAEYKIERFDKVKVMWNGVSKANVKFEKEGLTEWYFENGDVGGALNYSWSLSFPLFLNNMMSSIK